MKRCASWPLILLPIGMPARAAELASAPSWLLLLVLAGLALFAGLLFGWQLARRLAPDPTIAADPQPSSSPMPPRGITDLDAGQRLAWALWGSGDSLWVWDIDSDQLSWSSSEPLLGFARQEPIPGRDWRRHVVHREDRERVDQAMATHLSGGIDHYEVEYRLRTAGGEWTWVRARGRIVERDEAGRPQRVAGTFRVIERERAEEIDRRISAEVIRHMLEGVCIIDLDYRFLSANPAFLKLTGYAIEELREQPASMLDSSRHTREFYADVRRQLEERGQWSGEMWQRRRSGDDFLAWLQSAAVVSPEGVRTHFVAVMADVSDRHRAEQRLRYLAHYDPLTSLPNRALLRQRMRQRIDADGRPFALLFLDLDRFKHVNDSLGHAAGDELLRHAARRLGEVVPDRQNLARFGGDEFVVLVDAGDGSEAVEACAGEILDAFAGPMLVAGHELAISPSIGIAYFPDHGRSMDELLRNADAAMYEAKARGRNTWRTYSARLADNASQRTQLESALRKALDRDELRLVYQPKLSLRSGRITGVEALLRWRSAELGQVSPARFIPLAEETGLILQLGEWALRQALSQARAWADAGMPELRIGVNVSAVQLTRGGFGEMVRMILDGHKLAPGWLEIELTESALMADPKRAGQTIADLRAAGLRIAIDDFGTGYSSLSYLRGLAIDTVKIDKSFIDGIEHSVDDEVLTSTIILMAHSLGLSVVAEGVETEHQLGFLRGENCDEVQGHWLSRPLEAEACGEFLRSYRRPKGLVLPGAA